MSDAVDKTRLDKWLWHARFFKTRSLAAKNVSAGHVRLNGTKVYKPAQNVSIGDVLTFAQGKQIRLVKVLGHAQRRGPAAEAQDLYFDLTEEQDDMPENPRFEGKGRPEKRDRRALDLTRGKGVF